MSSSSLETASRTMYSGEPRSEQIGQNLVLKGWVHRRRDHGGLIFIDLRDRTGLMQLNINPEGLEDDLKVGIDITVNWDGETKEIVAKLQGMEINSLQLVAVTQGEDNLWPDGKPVQEGNSEFRCRFLTKVRDQSVGVADETKLTTALTALGLKHSDTHFVSIAHHIGEEYVLAVEGEVAPRLEGKTNPNLPTGEVELKVRRLSVLNNCAQLPFRIDDLSKVSEEIRLRHRYIDIRRPELQQNFVVRHKAMKAFRDWLSENGFYEVETPILAKPTPEGARDFLVPSRLSEGMCYALPQSPQIFKQILMVSGMDRYFQVARCFRDEDLRANRQPEFTQVDIEMSFVSEEEVLTLMENLAASVWKEVLGIEIPTPFRRMPYHEAMNRYGSDKPDLRLGMELNDVTEFLKGKSEFKVFNDVLGAGGSIVGIVHEGGADSYSNTALRPDGDFQKKVRNETGAAGIAFFRMEESGDLQSSISKFFSEEHRRELGQKLGMKPGDMAFFIADKKRRRALEVAGRLRLLIGRENQLIDQSKWEFLWVVDFPLFEYDDEEDRYEPAHHPFTAPHPDDIERLETEPGTVRSLAYDMALNGEEIAGGSIRIHRQDVQQRVFKAIGLSDEEAQAKFGFLLEALRFGAPPHGGIAFGFDRILMSILRTESIRDVIAFPKTQQGTCLMSGAPGDVTEEQLKEVHVKPLARKPKEGAEV